VSSAIGDARSYSIGSGGSGGVRSSRKCILNDGGSGGFSSDGSNSVSGGLRDSRSSCVSEVSVVLVAVGAIASMMEADIILIVKVSTVVSGRPIATRH